MVHISSAARWGPRARPSAALAWGLGLSAGLHLLLMWPAPVGVPRQTLVASTIKAELRAAAQAPTGPESAPQERHPERPSRPVELQLDSVMAQAVPGFRRNAAQPKPKAGGASLAPSRAVHTESSAPLIIPGDALTRYRLGLAWHLARDPGLRVAGSPSRPVTVELAVVLAGGRAISVEVLDDDGFAFLAAKAVERVRQASRVAPVPPELSDGRLQVSMAVRFEP